MKTRLTSAALAALMAATALPVSACAAELDTSNPKTPAFNTTDHMQYMDGYADGTFRPDATITRAEACKLIAGLLAEKNAGGDYLFSDVEASAWYAEAISQMTGFSLLSGYADGTFQPDAPITRAEFATILSRFPHKDIASTESFSDVTRAHWAYDAIQVALGNGWVGGYADGTFKPDAFITRAEAVTLLNRVLGRQGDAAMAATGDGIRIMPDVPSSHWAYLAMIEATTDHKYEMTDNFERWTTFDKETTTLAPGWHNVLGELFHVNDSKQFDKNTTVDGIELNHDGRFTTGSEKLDTLLTAVAAKVVKSEMTQMEKLRAMYDYAKEHFGYLGIGTVDTTIPGWQIEQATNMLTNGKGNCYSWASGFTYLARKVGFDAKAIAGTGVSPKGNESVHAWTEITIDGTAYTFDPQIESIYASRYNEHYDLFMKKYGESEWGYKADENSTQPGDQIEADAALSALLDKVYEGVETNGPTNRTPLYKGMGADGMSYQLSYFLGSNDLPIEAGLASEGMITSYAHSVVVARMKDGTDMEAVKKTIRETCDPYKWICVGVSDENVLVENVGNVVILIMDNDNAQKLLKNFKSAL